MYPPTVVYAIARIQQTEDLGRAETRRRARQARQSRRASSRSRGAPGTGVNP